MARSALIIRLDFEKAKAAAQKLDDIADGIAGVLSGDYEDSLMNIHANWQGENATHFLTKGEDLKTKIDKTVKDLRAAAEVIRKIAQNTYDTEMQALEIAKNRSFNS